MLKRMEALGERHKPVLSEARLLRLSDPAITSAPICQATITTERCLQMISGEELKRVIGMRAGCTGAEGRCWMRIRRSSHAMAAHLLPHPLYQEIAWMA
jgi:hypothetical protein